MRRRRHHWENTHIAVEINGSGKKPLSEREVSISLNHYSKDQLPWPDEHHVYVKDNAGSLLLKKSEHCERGIGITLYGVNTPCIPQYVTEQSPKQKALHHREAFATASKKNIPQKFRNEYPIKTYSSCQDFAQDRGHGIDFILTIPEANHSSIDEANFTPQNSDYNRQVRRTLVGKLIKENGISYKEISIYKETPSQIKQKICGKYTISKKEEEHLIDVPEGFLFLVYDSLKQIRTIYYFPNFIDYKKLKEVQKIEYIDMPKIFEIVVPTEKLFGKPINLFGVDIYEDHKTDEEIQTEIDMKMQVGLRMLLGQHSVIFKTDIANELIPLEAQKALQRTLALKQLHDMAENEYLSIDKKITFFEMLISQKETLGQVLDPIDPAFLWLKKIEEQVNIDSTLEEKQKLHNTYLLIKSSFPKTYDDLIKAKDLALSIKINQCIQEASDVEEELPIFSPREIVNFLEKTERKIMDKLKQVDTIEKMLDLDVLINFAAYYGGLGRDRSEITDYDRKKAHDLYHILFTEFFNEINWDGVLLENHLKELFIESPELVSYQHRLVYAHFFKKIELKEAMKFWDQKATECKAKETTPVYEKVELVANV